MKILKKFVPYKIRRALPMLGLAAGSMLMPSCSNDDEPDVPVPPHDTTYTWGLGNFKDPVLKEKIRASSDSASVVHIILKSDGKSWGGTYNETEFRYLVIEPLIQAGGENTRNKFKGAGTIKHVYTHDQEDYDWLVNFGYDIIPLPPEYFQKQR